MPTVYAPPAMCSPHTGDIYIQRMEYDSGPNRYANRLYRRGALTTHGTALTLVHEFLGPDPSPIVPWRDLFSAVNGALYRATEVGMNVSHDYGRSWINVVNPVLVWPDFELMDMVSTCPVGGGIVKIARNQVGDDEYYGIMRHPGPPQGDSAYLQSSVTGILPSGPVKGFVFQEPGSIRLLATNGANFVIISDDNARTWTEVAAPVWDDAGAVENFAMCVCPVGGGLAAIATATGTSNVLFKRNAGAFSGQVWPTDGEAGTVGVVSDGRKELAIVQAFGSPRLVIANSTDFMRVSDDMGVNWADW